MRGRLRQDGIVKRLLAACALAIVFAAVPANSEQEAVGEIVAIEGSAEVQHAGSDGWTAVRRGIPVFLHDVIRTGTAINCRVVVSLKDHTQQTLGASGWIRLDQVGSAGKPSIVLLMFGQLRALIPTGFLTGAVQVKTPDDVIAGSRDTMFVITYDPNARKTVVVGLEGTTWVRAANGTEVLLGPKMMTEVTPTERPTSPRRIDEGRLKSLVDATQVTTGGLSPDEEIPPAPPASKTTPPGPPPGAEPEIPFREPPVPDQRITPPTPAPRGD